MALLIAVHPDRRIRVAVHVEKLLAEIGVATAQTPDEVQQRLQDGSDVLNAFVDQWDRDNTISVPPWIVYIHRYAQTQNAKSSAA